MMALITEAQIDAVIEQLSQPEGQVEAALVSLATNQPHLHAYLFSNTFALLSSQERDYLLYLTTIIWKTVEDYQPGKLSVVSEQQLGDAEEANWALLNEVKSRTFRERVNPFFKNYPQEDLLAFVEDALTDVEDDFVTSEAKEHLFVALKSIIDRLQQAI